MHKSLTSQDVGDFLHQNDPVGPPQSPNEVDFVGRGGARQQPTGICFANSVGCELCDDAVQGYFDNYVS